MFKRWTELCLEFQRNELDVLKFKLVIRRSLQSRKGVRQEGHALKSKSIDGARFKQAAAGKAIFIDCQQ